MASAGREEQVQRGRRCRNCRRSSAGDAAWQPAVVVLAVEEYERLRHVEKAMAPTFADLLLAMPQDDEEFERFSLPSRSADF